MWPRTLCLTSVVDTLQDGSDTALIRACMEGHPEVVHALLDAGADFEYKGQVGERNVTNSGLWIGGGLESGTERVCCALGPCC